jgi:hypothetical protein
MSSLPKGAEIDAKSGHVFNNLFSTTEFLKCMRGGGQGSWVGKKHHRVHVGTKNSGLRLVIKLDSGTHGEGENQAGLSTGLPRQCPIKRENFGLWGIKYFAVGAE